MAKLSVVIITFNEEGNIGRCIDSVRSIADEIIVLDSYSTDRTVTIASEKGALVSQGPFQGYVEQKNRALALANNDYVLSLDADEALSDELCKAIGQIRNNFTHQAYRMNRRAYYCGRFINHGSWYPEPKVRLFNRHVVKWGGLDPHDRIIPDPDVKVLSVKGDILHYICNSVDQHKQRSENFSRIAAMSLHRAGRKSNWFKIIGSPLWFFISNYLLRGGFLDGWRGWEIAKIQTGYHYKKYIKLSRLGRR